MVSEKVLVKNPIGIFKGFTESGREFLAEIVTPYQPEFVLLLGSFMLVTVLDNEALLGRITQFYPMGTMAGAEADEYLSQLQRLNRPVPEDVKELKLRYNVKIRLLGTVELVDDKFRYRPGVRALPHLGAAVSLPTDDALQFICNARLENEPDAVPIGHYALGDREFPNLEIKFSFSRLLSRRTLVFARAGYGKSNLIKLLVSKLYEQNPRVGMLIFDPEGEYSFRDAQGRPGLADLPGAAERLVVFTDRRAPEERYKPFIAGSVKLNLRRIAAAHVVEICLPEDRLERGWAISLTGFNQKQWAETVDLLGPQASRVDLKEFGQRFDLDGQAAPAVIRNIRPVVRRLDDPSSYLPHSLLYHLAKGHIVVVDISLLSSGTGQQVAGLILKTVFDHNVEHFTADEQDAVIPVVAVIEEAQNVLSAEKMKREDSPFVEWVKEGRKYNLGAIVVTQQPGAISDQLLSQGDNFFALHLVSSVDLDALKRNNAHFSDDILSYILNEPIEGNTYFWSAPSQPYVISSKLLSFEEYVEEKTKQAAEHKQIGLAVQTYQQLAEEIPQLINEIIASENRVPVYTPESDGTILSGYGAIGQVNLRLQVAGRFFKAHKELKAWMLPQFFEVWDDGKVALQRRWVLQQGQSARGFKDGRGGDYLLIELSQISFQAKGLDDRRVTLVSQEEQTQA